MTTLLHNEEKFWNTTRRQLNSSEMAFLSRHKEKKIVYAIFCRCLRSTLKNHSREPRATKKRGRRLIAETTKKNFQNPNNKHFTQMEIKRFYENFPPLFSPTDNFRPFSFFFSSPMEIIFFMITVFHSVSSHHPSPLIYSTWFIKKFFLQNIYENIKGRNERESVSEWANVRWNFQHADFLVFRENESFSVFYVKFLWWGWELSWEKFPTFPLWKSI